MQVERIVNSVFSSNTYILQEEGSNDAYLVDVGDIEQILAKGLNIKGVFITHGHFDHIYGIKDLIEYYPDCKIYTNAIGRDYLGDMKLNLSKYHGVPVEYHGDNVIVVAEGDEISILSICKVIVYETPGHNPSCLVFRVGDYLFTGDAYIPNVKLITNIPKADKELGLANRNKIKQEFIDLQTIVCAGHGVVMSKDER